MKILITGANGFIGKNLLFYLKNQNNFKIFNSATFWDETVLFRDKYPVLAFLFS